ncbi:MAG: flagellar hook-associated protein FlgK [Deltaproteobacteria bacterium]|nr:flagellar hook-associated protein FlgK [Deltaproteobacteria bacterium]
MVGVFAVLGNAAVSLSAHRLASATASNNLENVNTPGYARQRALLVAGADTADRGGRVGSGVLAVDVRQARDRWLENRMPGALGEDAAARSAAAALGAVSALDPEAAGGVADAVGAFFAALRGWSQDPANASWRVSVLGAATTMTQAFNRTAAAVEDAWRSQDVIVTDAAREVTDLTARLAELNRQVRVARGTGATPNTLLDQRTLVRDRLAELTGATSLEDADGNLNVGLPGGMALVQGQEAASMTTRADPANAGHVVVLLTRTDGSGPQVVEAAQLGGQVGGALAARDGALANAGAALDALAFDLAGRLNVAHSAGVGLDGVSGRNLLDAGATAASAARRLAVSVDVAGNPSALAAAGSAGDLPGGNTTLQALLAVDTTAGASGDTPGGTAAALSASYGAAVQQAQARADGAAAQLAQLGALRESTSGVNVDEEMVTLMQAQRAYEATLKVITTADQMLDALMKLR